MNISLKKDTKGAVQSMGFGFAEFETDAAALTAMKRLQVI